MRTPRDFLWLSEQLGKSGERLSATTLKRLWGYLPGEVVTPHSFTLDTLSRFLGFQDYVHYVQCKSELPEEDSDPVLGRMLYPARELRTDQRVVLTWRIGRLCKIRHLGGGQFVVEQSERTRLQPGNTFHCEVLIEDEPLYLDHLVQENRKPTGYCCGKQGGIHYVVED